MRKSIFVLFLMGLSFALGMMAVRAFPSGAGLNTKHLAQEQAAIRETLQAQSAAWSRGDVERFMEDYWKSDDLRFASGGTVKYGWQTTLDRYKARYPDRATMGELEFSDLNVEMLSADHALVFGRWTLKREADMPTGLFTLHLAKMSGDWVIVSDHTSSA